MASQIKTRLDLMNDFIKSYLIFLTNCQSGANFLKMKNNNVGTNDTLPMTKNFCQTNKTKTDGSWNSQIILFTF